MSKTTSGWVTFIVALGMMCGLLSPEVSKLTTWGQIFLPSFIAVVMAHFATVVVAFVAGKMIPTERDTQLRTRTTDTSTEPPEGTS